MANKNCGIVCKILLCWRQCKESRKTKIEELKIGDTGPAGGIVFITPSTQGNTTGLWFETGPSRNPVFDQITWAAQYGDSGATGTKIGTGESNTKLIVSVDGNTKDNCAAAYCSNYVYNGFADWFLPSDEEMDQLFACRDIVGGFNDGDLYWSSTQGVPGADSNYEGAHVQIFSVGGAGGYNVSKDELHFVRPVRSFSDK